MSQFPISALRSVAFDTPDLQAATAFYCEAWGLTLWRQDENAAWLRGTGDDSYLLALHAGETAQIRDMTFRASSQADLEGLAHRVVALGLDMVQPLGPVMDDPAEGLGFGFLDPRRRTIRVVHNDQRRTPDAIHPDQPNRLSHVNINSCDVDADVAFFEQALGFRMTDRSKLMGFVRTNSDHHSIVIAQAPIDTLNHVAFNHASWEGVMRASGRLVDRGHPIAWGVGRHGPGDNVFSYFIDPFGFVVEHTAEVLQVDDAYRVGSPKDWVWPAGRTDQWGIAPPKSEACKTAQLAIPFAQQS